ncbi:hypothetical protein QTG54_006156 [Skeletonema marinoi]|uniref:Uncharacterized protein n=1 Tax=Skeletonema marinoi TaxID=267567 RepID=A0AAD9DF58_9STRA|nr:hypothetical protein QTG54_006156 [Skeletonema marinoi]
MSQILPQKRSAATDRPDPPSSTTTTNSQRYTKLLSVLTKSLQQSRDKVESEAAHLIKEIYGDMTSLFTTGEDDDGVTQLVDLLLGKLDTVHDRFNVEKSSSSSNMTKLESILEEQQIQQLLQRVETAIERVEMDEQNFQQDEAADKQSAEEAVKQAHTLRVDSVAGKLRKMTADQFAGYHSHKKKEEYFESLQKELGEVTKENDEMEAALVEKWEEWQKNLGDVKGALGVLQQLGSVEEEEGKGPRDP